MPGSHEPATGIYPDSDEFCPYFNIHFSIILLFTALISSSSKQEDCSTITESPYGKTHWHPLPYARAPFCLDNTSLALQTLAIFWSSRNYEARKS